MMSKAVTSAAGQVIPLLSTIGSDGWEWTLKSELVVALHHLSLSSILRAIVHLESAGLIVVKAGLGRNRRAVGIALVPGTRRSWALGETRQADSTGTRGEGRKRKRANPAKYRDVIPFGNASGAVVVH